MVSKPKVPWYKNPKWYGNLAIVLLSAIVSSDLIVAGSPWHKFISALPGVVAVAFMINPKQGGAK